ncbi:AAEL014826-PA, partial [Aedes aegypti]
GAIGYDGAVNEFETVYGAKRFLRSFGIGVSISVDYSWSLWGLDESDPNYEEVISGVHQRSADRILNGCLTNGGLYIKMGQGVAAMNHIIPKEYIRTLKKLEDQCLPRKPGEVRKLFEQDFGKPPEEVFQTFDYEPIAAASLAQVFRGTTKEGQQVAIKVQYADLRKRFNADLRTILFLQDMIALIHKSYNFGWIVRDLQGTLREELDFMHEGRNAERCAEDLRKHDSVYVPKRVLTAEFIDGCKINDTDRLKHLKINLAKLDVALFRAFADQIFRTGFVHADPHPGNVFVRKDPASGRPQLVLLDHGLYGNLTPEVRANLCRFWEAIVLKDHTEMAKFARALNVQDYRTFAEILLQRPLELKGSKLTTRLSEEDLAYMTLQAKEHFDKVMQTLRSMPRNLIFVLRNLNTIRAIAREHGDPVDRPKVMARCALTALRQYSVGFRGYFRSIFRRINFEYQLWKFSFQFWLVSSYLKLLTRLGRSPDTAHLLDVQVDV